MISLPEVAAWAPSILDVGFGMGESLLTTALEHPDARTLGVEVHEAGITRAMTDLAEHEALNVRIVRNDVVEVLDQIPRASLTDICVFFPDPWPKASQAHRRLLRPDVVRAFAERLAPGGLLRLATDAAHYAEQMREVCRSEPMLRATASPSRATTRYERRGHEAGRASVDLSYERFADG
jgi:tRNA (guanine-N7-)-methyltransferase